jgi:hypothetical protein
MPRVPGLHRQPGNSVRRQQVVEAACGHRPARQLADAVLGRDLPGRGGAHEDVVGFVGHRGPGPRGELRVVVPPPQQCVRVRQQAHQRPSQASIPSAGSASKKA